jgi:peptide/nickel transport system permease protein
MGFKFVFLWTDIALYAIFAVLVFYVWRVLRQPNLQATWKKVMHDPAALSAGVVLAIFSLITALDSVHFRRVLESTANNTNVYYDTRTLSLLDVVMERQIEMREITY